MRFDMNELILPRRGKQVTKLTLMDSVTKKGAVDCLYVLETDWDEPPSLCLYSYKSSRKKNKACWRVLSLPKRKWVRKGRGVSYNIVPCKNYKHLALEEFTNADDFRVLSLEKVIQQSECKLHEEMCLYVARMSDSSERLVLHRHDLLTGNTRYYLVLLYN